MHSNTLLPPLTLRRAVPDDLPGVLTLLADTAEWLHLQGVRQWPRGGFGPGRIAPLIDEQVLYLLEGRFGETVATIALDGHADAEFWTKADEPASALYVHKLAVSRAVAGTGLGDALLDWAGGAVAASGLDWLRLDCSKDNPRLQRYYQRRGFRHLRTVDLPHRASGALFQRPAELRTSVAEGLFRTLDLVEA